MLVVVAIVVASLDPVPGDRASLVAVHDLVGTRIDAPMRAVGLAATAWLLVPLTVLLAAACVVRRAWWTLTLVAGTAVSVWLVNPGLKRVFQRDRPDVRDVVEPTSRWSFPSGHATAAAAFATLLVLLAWPTRARLPVTIGAVVSVALVGASRLVLGVHFPTDLVAGTALGTAAVTGLAAWTLTRSGSPGPAGARGRTAGCPPRGEPTS